MQGKPRKRTIIAIVGILVALFAGALAKSLVKSILGRGAPVPVHKPPTYSADGLLVEMCKVINANLPMHVNKEARLDSATPGPGNRVTYLLTLVNVRRDSFDADAFVQSMKPQLIQGYSTNPDMAAFRERQLELRYQYRDRDGAHVATIVVSPMDFRADRW